MIQETLLRLAGLETAQPLTICNEEHRFIVAEQLREINQLGTIILEVEFAELTKLPELTVSNHAAEEYITRYTSLFSSPWLTGKRVGIYEHSSAGRDLYYRIFENLGADVIALERSDQFVPIDTEAVSEEDTLKAIAWSKNHNLDVVFLLMVMATGRWFLMKMVTGYVVISWVY